MGVVLAYSGAHCIKGGYSIPFLNGIARTLLLDKVELAMRVSM